MRRYKKLLSAWVVMAVVGLGLPRPLASRLQSVDRQPGPPDLAKDLSPEALDHLENWLLRDKRDEPGRAPKRDIFRKATEPVPVALSEPVAAQSSPAANPLRLVGFIFSGGSMGEENPLAAVRFEERMWLVRPGDRIGTYRVERWVVGEEIELVERDSGETIRLVLE